MNEFPAVLTVDANDSKGNYTLSWKYARDTIRLYERKDSGAEVDVFGGEYAPVGSKTFSKSQSGTYSYRLVDCTYIADPTGASPSCADADTETIDVSLPIFSSSLSSSSNSSNINQLSSSSISISSHASKSSQSSSASSVVMINPLLGEVLNPVNDPMSEEIYMGALVGSQRVGDDGSFNYSLPLIIPAGINGAQPKLQLSYNSNAKNGLLGWGVVIGWIIYN